MAEFPGPPRWMVRCSDLSWRGFWLVVCVLGVILGSPFCLIGWLDRRWRPP